MKHPRRLASIERTHLRSICRFTRGIAVLSTPTQTDSVESSVSYAAINLLNCWSNFVRMYYVCCAHGSVSPSGAQISSALSGQGKSFNDLIGHAITHFRPNATPRANGIWDSRDEPTWHDSATILALANKFNFSNLADINAAFSFGYSAHKNLVVFRNYYGHKNRHTMKKAQSLAPTYSIQSNLKPTEILLRSPSGTTATLLDVWKIEICDTISYLCS